MKNMVFCLTVAFLSQLLLSNCKRDKLAPVYKPIKDLFAGGGVWYVQKYEVEGADSTENAFPGITSNRQVGRMTFVANKNAVYGLDEVYGASLVYNDMMKNFRFSRGYSICNRIGDDHCPKNIFYGGCTTSYWGIVEFTKERLELYCNKNDGFNVDIQKSARLILIRN